MMFSAFFFRFGNKGEKWSGSRLRKLFQCWKSQQFTFLPQYERKSPKWRDAKTCQFSSKKTIHSLRYDTSQITVQKKKNKREMQLKISEICRENLSFFFLAKSDLIVMVEMSLIYLYYNVGCICAAKSFTNLQCQVQPLLLLLPQFL